MRLLRQLALLMLCLALAGCRQPLPDHPRLTPGVRMKDITISSTALQRDMTYRVITPATIPANTKLPVIWLLHGADATYRDWSNDSDISSLAESGVILVMPDAVDSYYVNSATRSDQNYENYIVQEIIPSVRTRFPAAATDRAHNAIIGISRGGFGAVLLALKHPELFSFVGGMSSAIDLAERPFRWRETSNSLHLRRTFGPLGTATRDANDPFKLITRTPPAALPYFYFTCAEQDVLLAPNRRFTALLATRNIPFEFHTTPGDHDWTVWNAQLSGVEASVLAHLNLSAKVQHTSAQP